MFSQLRSFFDKMGNMGIWIRLNDARTEPPTEEGRAWGETVAGFQLSIFARSPESLSVMLKNQSDQPVKAATPKYQVDIDATLKAYGRAWENAPYQGAIRTFPPHTSVANDLPLTTLYNLNPGAYNVSVSCQVPGGTLVVTSNKLRLNVQ